MGPITLCNVAVFMCLNVSRRIGWSPCVQLSDDYDHQSSSRRMNSRATGKNEQSGKLRLAHYKGSLVIVKPVPTVVAPTVTQLDKVEMTTVRSRPTFQHQRSLKVARCTTNQFLFLVYFRFFPVMFRAVD